MAGWSHTKRVSVEKAFYEYLDRCYVNSKDAGLICLGENLYQGQRDVITQIFDALEEDIHDIYILKSRQLGISTIIRSLIVFLIGVHKGIKGALVFDTSDNKSEARNDVVTMIKDLPAGLKFPKIKDNNRAGLTLLNDSKILFFSAGIRQSKSSGTLGRSVGLSIAHCSEMCSWQNDEGLESFKQSLSDKNPDRLYVWESTARGFNSWNEMWLAAREDVQHCRCIFLGWWSKDSQRIDRDDKDWELYGSYPPTAEEAKKIAQVKELYGHEVSQEQLAWVRRKYDPAARQEGDTQPEFTASTTRIQEQPWTEDEAFQQTGAIFFSGEKLKDQSDKHVQRKFESWMFMPGNEFPQMLALKAETSKSTELKVWEAPKPESVYVLGIDPAFGENEENDRSSIQILRCYADGIDQVAEYAYSMISTKHLAWVVAALMAWYGNEPLSEVHYILELNGPGSAVLNEMKSLKFQIEHGYAPLQDLGLKNIFQNERQYIYSRPDSMSGGGGNWHWKCLALDTLIPTPDGWTTIGKLKAGNVVFSDAGEPCTVLGCSPEFVGKECFEVIFEDGTSIVADAEHLWPVNGGEILQTQHLVSGKHSIACTEPLQLPDATLPISPYVLGVWLGDGHSEGGRYSCSSDDIFEMSKNIVDNGFFVSEPRKEKGNRKTCYQTIIGLRTALAANNLLKNKHIPPAYLRGSYTQRLSLLQGLMDTDGSIDINRQCGFTTTSARLASDFAELIRSLGFKSKHMVKNPTLKYKGEIRTCAPAYQFWFTAYDDVPLFKLQRKLARQVVTREGGLGGAGIPRKGISKRHKIVAVTPVESVPVKCIKVSSLSHLFLAGEGMIPTHNTTQQLKIMIMEQLRGFVTNGMLHVRSAALVEEMKTIAREGDSIKAEGSLKDDRVLAMALAVHHWETRVRRQLIMQRRTREAEMAKRNKSVVDQIGMFNASMMESMFKQKASARIQAARMAQHAAWRYGRRR